MYPEDQDPNILRVICSKVNTGQGARYEIRECVFCGHVHTHTAEPGHRVAHCTPRALAPDGGYILVLDTEFAKMSPEEKRSIWAMNLKVLKRERARFTGRLDELEQEVATKQQGLKEAEAILERAEVALRLAVAQRLDLEQPYY